MRRFSLIAAALAAALLIAGSAFGGIADDVFTVHNLVSAASAADATLVNGWGLSAGPTTPWWVSDNGTNATTLYNGSGAKQALTVCGPGRADRHGVQRLGHGLRRSVRTARRERRASCSRPRAARSSAGRRR